MHRIAYLFPLVTAVALLLLFRNYDQWWAYLLMVALSDLLLWLIIRRASRKREYLSGYAVNIQHHEAWTERVVIQEAYTDGNGKTRHRTVIRYHYHPDIWFMKLNTGVEVHVSESVYDRYRMIWGTERTEIYPYHPNCVGGGGGQLYEWNGVYADAGTSTYNGLYVNYVINSNSIFNTGEVTKEEINEFGLIDYPDIDDTETDVVLCSDNISKRLQISEDIQREYQLFNAFSGENKQIHAFVLVFDAAGGITTALKQQAYWKGGNKNEFVVCLGVDVEENSVRWCKAFSWCDIPRLESATESYFIEHKELDLLSYASWLTQNVSLWKRKEFKDFKYLGISLSPWRKVLVYFIALLLSAAMVVIACDIAITNRDEDISGIRDCSGYGYELLDKYFGDNSSDTEYY